MEVDQSKPTRYEEANRAAKASQSSVYFLYIRTKVVGFTTMKIASATISS